MERIVSRNQKDGLEGKTYQGKNRNGNDRNQHDDGQRGAYPTQIDQTDVAAFSCNSRIVLPDTRQTLVEGENRHPEQNHHHRDAVSLAGVQAVERPEKLGSKHLIADWQPEELRDSERTHRRRKDQKECGENGGKHHGNGNLPHNPAL